MFLECELSAVSIYKKMVRLLLRLLLSLLLRFSINNNSLQKHGSRFEALYDLRNTRPVQSNGRTAFLIGSGATLSRDLEGTLYKF